MYRKKNTKNYTRLKGKIFWQTALMMLAALLSIWIIYLYVFFGRFADGVVLLMQKIFRMDYNEALTFYQRVFRSNFDLVMLAGAVVCFFFIFHFFLNWFTRYFHEIDHGIDALIERDGIEIEMSKEMEPMEQKLNQVRLTLEQQFLDIQEAERKKDELVMYLAHDIRTPLTSVIGYLNLLQEMPDLTDEQRLKFVRVTLEKAERLETLVNEFFDITRYNRSEVELNKNKIDLYYMLVQLKEEVYPLLSESGKTVEIETAEDVTVYGNADKLARVFHNLLKNAIAYGRQGSEINIRATEEADKTIICFSNHGINISKEEQKRLFDKFYRMDTARQTNSGGAGLGLAIAKELVMMHGGDISVQSADGVTTFRVVLPKE